MSAPNIPEEESRETIYNVMFGIALKYDQTELKKLLISDATKQNTLRHLIVETIKELCASARVTSTHECEFYTIKGNVITQVNISENFVELITGLSYLKKMESNKPAYDVILSQLVQTIEKKDMFKNIIQKFIQFYVDATTEAKSVSGDLIRQTFYNMMVEHVLFDKTISKVALENMESFIFLDLSAHTIINSVLLSQKYNGILLQGNGIVTDATCPEEYKKLYIMLITLKNKMVEMKLNEKELELIKLSASSDPEVKIQDDLIRLKTPAIISLITIIKDMAIQISQIYHFRSIIDNVITFSISAM